MQTTLEGSMDAPRKGLPMQLISGRPFWPEDIRPGDVTPRDCFLGMSHECRYAGQIPRWYCVLQHSVLVSEIAEWLATEMEAPRVDALRVAYDALWHDAGEGVVKDIPRGLKRALGLPYAAIEHGVMVQLAPQLGISFPENMSPLVQQANDLTLSAEAHSFRLVEKNPPLWKDLPPRPVINGVVVHVDPLNAYEAREMFAERFSSLRSRLAIEGVIVPDAQLWRAS